MKSLIYAVKQILSFVVTADWNMYDLFNGRTPIGNDKKSGSVVLISSLLRMIFW
jgi:hypothetical protein